MGGVFWVEKAQGKVLVRMAGRLGLQTGWQPWEETAAHHAGEGGRK